MHFLWRKILNPNSYFNEVCSHGSIDNKAALAEVAALCLGDKPLHETMIDAYKRD